jgi:hypothetical protein
MWGPRRLKTLWASTACYRDGVTLSFMYVCIRVRMSCVHIKIVVFREASSCKLVDRYQRFGGISLSIFYIPLYTDSGFPWLSSAPPDKWKDITSSGHDNSFQIPFQFISHSTRHRVTDSLVEWSANTQRSMTEALSLIQQYGKRR